MNVETPNSVPVVDPAVLDKQLAADLRAALSDNDWTGKVVREPNPQAVDGTIETSLDAVALDGGADEGAQPPDHLPPTDISFVPEQFQSEFTSLSPAAAKWLKDGVEIRGTLTQKTQEYSEHRRVLEADAEANRLDAAVYRRMKSDKELWNQLKKFLDDREAGVSQSSSPAPKDDDEAVDPLSLSPDEFRAYQKRRDEKLIQLVRQEVAKGVDDQVYAPRRLKATLQQTLIDEFITRQGLDPNRVEKAAQKCGAWAAKLGIKVSPENVVDLVEPFIAGEPVTTNESAAAPVKAPVVAGNGAAGPRRVATPPSGGGIAPSPLPPHKREGRPTATRDDFHKEVLRGLSHEFGMEVTNDDLRKLLFQID